MKRYGILILMAFALMTSFAQKKEFTLEDLNFGGTNFRQMSPERVYMTWWGDELVKMEFDKCSVVNKKNGKLTELFNLEQINSWAGFEGKDKIAHLYGVSFPYADKSVAMFQTRTKRVMIDFKEHKLAWSQNSENQEFADWNKGSRAVAYVQNDNLFVMDGNGDVKQLSNDGSRDIVYGQSVHRDEFGIYKGTFWSNNGEKLAFYRMDQSMVIDYPLVDIDTREAELAPTKYPMAGMTSHKVTVGVYDLASGKTVYLKAGDPTDRYFTNISWSPDAKTVYLIEVNRDQNHEKLCAYDAQNGELKKVLYEESHPKYVHPENPIVFLPWDNTKFLMQSDKDGFRHLYLMDVDGNMLKQVTSGKWVVMSLEGFDVKNKNVIITSSESGDIQRNVYSVNIKSGKRTLLDNGRGFHLSPYTVKPLSASGKYICDEYSEPDVPRVVCVTDTKSAKSVELFRAANPWEGYNVPEYSAGTIKAADGKTDLWYRMVKPVNFDPTKKYPTIIYVYGGPNARNVEASWNYWSRGWETYMAQKGYLLFILDNRGSRDRGMEFEQATFRQLGQVEMEDQMEGVKFLQSLPYVDADRMGVHGWSFGGFMTITMMTNHPEVFKVGVAGGPVIDWKLYEVMYGERYMDTPQANPEGYEKTCLLNKAKDLKGKLQIIIGMNDPTCVPQHSLSFLRECIKAGTQPDFFVYPGEPHNMRGHQSVHLHERISNYFDTYLK